MLARDPDDVTAWTWRLIAGRGLQIEPAAERALFDEVIRRHPGHVVAHEQYLQYVCAKWAYLAEDPVRLFALARRLVHGRR
ncbi:hypothetical protein [Actinoplanes sp. NPDC051851]|uniref:hypothetical protein n=1 Tax=Actinoplanes sp. NPDC051851 TaxID=3154753 RepID=UPI00342C6D02